MPERVPPSDLHALRQELSLADPVDVRSSAFVRFVIRVSERLNLDIPREDWPRLATVGGCAEYLRERV